MSNLKISSIPMKFESRDELRDGLGSLRTDAQSASHPVQQIQQTFALQDRANQKLLMARVYGQHLPTKIHMEEKILGQFRRFPGLPSSYLGLETLLGTDTDIDFGDYLNNQNDAERAINHREEMEFRFGDRR